MKQPEIIQIRIINWEKWNPSGKGGLWFKFSSNFFEDPVIRSLTMREQMTFIFLLTRSGLIGSSEVTLIGSIVSSVVSHRGVTVESTLSKLSKLGLIEIQKERKKEREREKNPPPPKKGEDLPGKVFELWVKNCGHIHRPKTLSESRRKKIRARLKDYPDLDFWERYSKAVGQNPFCCGESEADDRGHVFKASFDWFIEERNARKFDEQTGLWVNSKTESIDFMAMARGGENDIPEI